MKMRILAPAAIAIMSLACGGGINLEDYATPEDLLPAAEEAFEDGDCRSASAAYRRLVFELPPRDPRLSRIRLNLGECAMKSGEYLEASRQFDRLAADHPADSMAPVALMRSGDALSRLWRRPELDATYGEQALNTYQRALSTYPASSVADSLNDRIAEMRTKFARKEFKTGEFYLRLKAYDSAIIYFTSLVDRYPTTEYAPLALLKLVEIYDRIGYADERSQACEYLRRFHSTLDDLEDSCPGDPAP